MAQEERRQPVSPSRRRSGVCLAALSALAVLLLICPAASAGPPEAVEKMLREADPPLKAQHAFVLRKIFSSDGRARHQALVDLRRLHHPVVPRVLRICLAEVKKQKAYGATLILNALREGARREPCYGKEAVPEIIDMLQEPAIVSGVFQTLMAIGWGDDASLRHVIRLYREGAYAARKSDMQSLIGQMKMCMAMDFADGIQNDEIRKLCVGLRHARYKSSAMIPLRQAAPEAQEAVPALAVVAELTTTGSEKGYATRIIAEIRKRSGMSDADYKKALASARPGIPRVKAIPIVAPERTLEQWLERLKDDRVVIRHNAATELGELKEKRAVPALIQALEDGNSYVAGRAAVALGKIGDRSALPVLIEKLRKASTPMDRYAANALRGFPCREAEDALLQVVQTGGDPTLINYATSSLGEMGTQRAFDALKQTKNPKAHRQSVRVAMLRIRARLRESKPPAARPADGSHPKPPVHTRTQAAAPSAPPPPGPPAPAPDVQQPPAGEDNWRGILTALGIGLVVLVVLFGLIVLADLAVKAKRGGGRRRT